MRNLVVAIGREFGSGGKEIGQKLADRLSINVMIVSYFQLQQKIVDSVKKSYRKMMRNRQTAFYILW